MTENNNNPSHPTYPPQQNAWYPPPPAFYASSYQPHPYASAPPHPYTHHPYGLDRHRGDEEGEGPEEEVEEVEGGPEDDGAYDEEERREDEDETLQLSEDFLEGTAEPTASIIAPSCMRAREPAEMKVINSLTLLNIITRIVKKVVQKCPGDLVFSKQMFIRNNWLSKQTYTLGFKAKLITQFLVAAVQQYQLLDTDESDLQTLHKVKVLPKAFAIAKVKMPRGHATAAQNVRAVHTPPHLLHPSSHPLPHTHTPPHSSSTSSHTPPRKRMGHPKRSPLLITGKAGEKEEEKGREERGRDEEGQLSVVEVVDLATEIPTNTNNTNTNNTNNTISNTTTATSSTTNTNNSTNNDDTEEEDIGEKPSKEGDNDKAKSRGRKRSFTDVNELDIDTEEELDPVPSSLPSSHPTLPTSPLPHSPSIPIEHLSKSIRATRTPPVPHSSSLPIPIASPSLPFPVSTPPTGAGNRAVRPIAIKHEPPVEFVDEYGYQYYMYDTQSNKKRARGVSPFNASRANGHAPTYKNPPVQSVPSPYAYPPTPYAPYPSYAHAPHPAHASHSSQSHTSLLPSPSPYVPPPTERDSWTEFLARVGRTEESVKGWPIDAVREELELQNFRGAKKGDVLNLWHSLQG